MVYLWKMVIFHSYVSLPEGNLSFSLLSSPSRLTSGAAGAEHDELTDCQDLSTYWCQIKWQKICQIECKTAGVSGHVKSVRSVRISEKIRTYFRIFHGRMADAECPKGDWCAGGASRFLESTLCEKTYGLEMVRVRDSQSISAVCQ